HTGVFYNRYENLRKMGFDAFYTLETVTRSFERVGSYVSDAEHYQSVLKTLRDTPARDMILCLTMQNHGGYTYWDFAREYGASPAFEGTYSADTQLALSNYCYLLERSDAALGDLITSLKAFEEPVWVVFFGDHLPPLGAQAYEELGLSLEGDAGHSVPYLIWSNRQNAPVKTDLKAYELPAYALSLCGLGQDPFFAHVEKLRAQGLEPDEVYERLSYDALFGAQYAYRAAAYSPEAPDYRVGGRMTLLGLKALKAGDGVLLEPVLQNSDQAYTLLVNGETFQQGHPLPDGTLSVLCAMPDGRGRVLNESSELSYADAADLLNGAAALECEQVPLSSLQFELFRNELWSSYCVFRSVETVSGLPLALTLEGKALQETPADSMNGAGQYSLYEGNGKLYWSVDKKEMRLFGLTSEGAAAYLSTREMLLYLQREGEKRLFKAVLQ
ncbi:MAG: hypothetical protein EOM66_10215, partial [Clostridia bacterium]|nr:hypothetical protein [Clostridia bacterium]